MLNLAPDIEVTGQASDGVEALERISTDPPDVVIIDIEMPRMDGLETTRHLREQGAPVHVVVLSVAYDRREAALAAGADAFIQKGEPMAHLMRVLEGFRPPQPEAAQAEIGSKVNSHIYHKEQKVMATLSVLKFDTPDGARQMLNTIEDLQKQQLITLQDAAIVTWPADKKKPKTEQLRSMAGVGALGGAFWGLLFGLLFFIPFVGLAIGAAMGALAGHFSDYGIDDNFINSVKDKVTPGTSALFLLTSGAVEDKVVPAMKGQKFEIIQTNLSKEQEDQLRAEFGES